MAAFEDEWVLMQAGYTTPGLRSRLRRLGGRLRGRPEPAPRPVPVLRIEPDEIQS